jgi:hypothetical protein
MVERKTAMLGRAIAGAGSLVLTLGCFGGPVDTGESAMTVRRCTELCAEEAWAVGCEGVKDYSEVEATCETELSNDFSPSQVASASVDDCEDYGIVVGAQDCSGGGDGGGGGEGPTWDECYEAGWADCDNFTDPSASNWGCDSADQQDGYETGYCECEAYYDDLYWCS